MMIKNLAIIDLDDIVADATERFNAARKPDGKLDWKIVFDPERVSQDLLIEGVPEVLLALEKQGYRVVYLTGRSESVRAATIAWLTQHNLWTPGQREVLIMRGQKDFRKSHIFKQEEIERFIAMYQPDEIICVDDNEDNLRWLRENHANARCYTSLAEVATA